MSFAPLRLTSPAKVNLYLHVTGKREDGYHLLDSMAVFAKGFEDTIIIEPAKEFSFHVTGPFAGKLSGNDLSAEKDSPNLVVRAAYAFSKLYGEMPSCSITLEKNIPLGAGLGGGSGDAATVFKGLEQIFQTGFNPTARGKILLGLGSDVPVCYEGKPCRFQGTGDIILPCPPLPQTYILLVWPDQSSMTKNIFGRMSEHDYTAPANWPDHFSSAKGLCGFLSQTTNSMMRAAIDEHPVIKDTLDTVQSEPECLLARMSGSGSCVFGLFESKDRCEMARHRIKATHPNWWLQSGQI